MSMSSVEISAPDVSTAMLLSRQGIARTTNAPPHVCLSCRLKSHTSYTPRNGTSGGQHAIEPPDLGTTPVSVVRRWPAQENKFSAHSRRNAARERVRIIRGELLPGQDGATNAGKGDEGSGLHQPLHQHSRSLAPPKQRVTNNHSSQSIPFSKRKLGRPRGLPLRFTAPPRPNTRPDGADDRLGFTVSYHHRADKENHVDTGQNVFAQKDQAETAIATVGMDRYDDGRTTRPGKNHTKVQLKYFTSSHPPPPDPFEIPPAPYKPPPARLKFYGKNDGGNPFINFPDKYPDEGPASKSVRDGKMMAMAQSNGAHPRGSVIYERKRQVNPRPSHQDAGLEDMIDQHTAADDLASTTGVGLASGERDSTMEKASKHRLKVPQSAFRWPLTISQYQNLAPRSERRLFHMSSRDLQHTVATSEPMPPPPPLSADTDPYPGAFARPDGIRAQLRQWQELNGHKAEFQEDDVVFDPNSNNGGLSNNLTRLPDEKDEAAPSQEEIDEDEHEAMAHYMQRSADETGESEANPKYLQMGDLVEIERLKSGREGLLGVFVRRTGVQAQFYTLHGRWLHMLEKHVQYSVPKWVSPELVKPLLKYLPTPEQVETNLKELMSEAYVTDMSIPRHVAGPLVSRMTRFYDEAKEIYRKNASALDGAHERLAHASDLRYGSLTAAASTLLKTPINQLSVTALFAVRQALTQAGFAFSIDARSHRLTGYLQIRSKEQVKLIDRVRRWLREWQDDLAASASFTDAKAKRHRPSEGAGYVHSFLDKARKIVARSREDRDPTDSTSVGPSKVRLPITPHQEAVRVTSEIAFTDEESDIVRFLEAWSLNNMFASLPTLDALPPVLVQATGLYGGGECNYRTGMQFLQELGTIMPFENRVRFDTNLLLPSSQHSRPLQNLMGKLMDMSSEPDFEDSMAHLRHDWGKLPVYCIDQAGAHEIDDGVSIEEAAVSTHGPAEWWVHIHIANPTAFFSRDHPLAKMARHMGETIYMPERTYMMLPRWCTQRFFSLAPHRPCLTFSARIDESGNTLEHKVTAGTIRNVMSLTPDDVGELLGAENRHKHTETTLTIGGEVPQQAQRKNSKQRMNDRNKKELKMLQKLAGKRQEIRRAAGGLFFDINKPDVSVWQNHKNPGLAWTHPFRKGWRRVEGDPVIRVKTSGLVNWFAPVVDNVKSLVQEHMLLACEIAAKWCDERQIPAIFRGSIPKPGAMDTDSYYRDILVPAAKASGTDQYPMHLGMRYIETFGHTALRTKPLKHNILGMPAYGKVTSPLRRYGDMIMHWQIEAALREEARTDKSLITSDPTADRRFLPFSADVLKTIFVGLQPRESLIMRSKQQAENHWIAQLLFRRIHFGEDMSLTVGNQPHQQLLQHLIPNPIRRDGQMVLAGISSSMDTGCVVHAYIHSSAATDRSSRFVGCVIKEFTFAASMGRPETHGLGDAVGVRQGDVWECTVTMVDPYKHITFLRPRRLVERVE